ncbi:MAG: hypothetical protein ACK518_03400 [bacterium]
MVEKLFHNNKNTKLGTARLYSRATALTAHLTHAHQPTQIFNNTRTPGHQAASENNKPNIRFYP